MGPGESLTTIMVFITIAVAVILRGPLGKALAERISGRAAKGDPEVAGEVDRLHHDLEEVKHRLGEAEERLDFTERLLAQQRQQGIAPGER